MLRTHVSQRTVLVVVEHTDLRRGRNDHHFFITPLRILQLARQHGNDILPGLLFREPTAHVSQKWSDANFMPVDKGPGVTRTSIWIRQQVARYHPDVVFMVASRGIDTSLVAELRQDGITTVVYAPERNSPLVKVAEIGGLLEDVADGKPLPSEEPANENAFVRTLFVERPPQHSSLNRLVITDPETYHLLRDIWMVTDETSVEIYERLRKMTEAGTLPKIVLAVLCTLAQFKYSSEATLNTNRLWQRLLCYGVDVDTIGRQALAILVEEGTLFAAPTEIDTDYLFTRRPDHPAHSLARRFSQKLVRNRKRLVLMSDTASYADRVIQAAEIYVVDPGNLTPEAQDDLTDWMQLVGGALNHERRMQEYATRGLPREHAVLFDREMQKILGTSARDTEDEPEIPQRSSLRLRLAKAIPDEEDAPIEGCVG